MILRYAFSGNKLNHNVKRKPFYLILKDLYSWQLREKEFNYFYYTMGLGFSSAKQKGFIGKKTLLTIKNKVERKLKENAGCSDIQYEAITKDKFYTNAILTANHIPCSQNLALIYGSNVIFPDGEISKHEELFKLKTPFLLKNTVIESGEGVFCCSIIDDKIEMNGTLHDYSSFIHFLGNHIWVVQKQYISHAKIREINSSALNTLRIVTILNGNEPEYLCGFHSFATSNSTTDSWGHGAVCVGIDIQKGCLNKFGYTGLNVMNPVPLIEHPDSRIHFKDYRIPYLEEAIALCVRAHRLLYFNFIIGWDVAVTDEGPIILEANERPGMNVAQCIEGGLRQKIISNANHYLK